MSRLERGLLILWFLVYLIVGVLTVQNYGISIDEPNNYRYANDSLAAYPSFFGMLYEPKYVSTYDGHGPAFVMISAILVRIIQSIFPNVFAPNVWHISYFLSFLLTGLCLYWLTKRWFNTWTAWGLLILFSTQPLLVGHAFINPKDIPFMFLFVLSIVLGFRLADSMGDSEPFISLERQINNYKNNFQVADPRRRRNLCILLALLLGTALALGIFSNQLNSLGEKAVNYFYTASPDSWVGHIFSFAASRSSEVPVEGYVTKVLKLIRRGEEVALAMGLLLFLAYFGLLLCNTTLPAVIRNSWKLCLKLWDGVIGLPKALVNPQNFSLLKNWFADIFRAFRNPWLILAGTALGLATGLRAIAPWAGIIVFIYLWAKVRSKAWATAVAYFLIAGIMTYLVWPRLWDSPVRRYLEGLGVISAFPDYPRRVLFMGHYYGDTALPRSYLPILMNLQFTEPFLFCFYLGLVILAWRLLRSRMRVDLLLYIGLAFVIPMFGLILLDPPLYNNFRHVMFLIPAMAMLAAFPLELIFSKMPQYWTRVLIIIAIALPGIYYTVKLYPYEYIYYNSLVRATNTYDQFELDYMRIALRELALDLNEIAPQGSTVVVTKSAGLFTQYSRPDLVIDKNINSILNLKDKYDYSVQLAFGRKWDIYPNGKTIIIIQRDGAVLGTAKDMQNSNNK